MERFFASSPYRVFCVVLRKVAARGRLQAITGYGTAVAFVLRAGFAGVGRTFSASVQERRGGTLVRVAPVDGQDAPAATSEQQALSEFLDDVGEELEQTADTAL